MAKASKNGANGAARLTEYQPGQSFPGVIGRTFDVSQPAWPAPHRAKEGAPNVVFIVIEELHDHTSDARPPRPFSRSSSADGATARAGHR
jgi:hypothetical protein